MNSHGFPHFRSNMFLIIGWTIFFITIYFVHPDASVWQIPVPDEVNRHQQTIQRHKIIPRLSPVSCVVKSEITDINKLFNVIRRSSACHQLLVSSSRRNRHQKKGNRLLIRQSNLWTINSPISAPRQRSLTLRAFLLNFWEVGKLPAACILELVYELRLELQDGDFLRQYRVFRKYRIHRCKM